MNICHFSFSITGVFLTKNYEYAHNDQNINSAVKMVQKNSPLPLSRWATLNCLTSKIRLFVKPLPSESQGGNLLSVSV